MHRFAPASQRAAFCRSFYPPHKARVQCLPFIKSYRLVATFGKVTRSPLGANPGSPHFPWSESLQRNAGMTEPISRLPIGPSQHSRPPVPITLFQIGILLVAALFLAQCSKRQGETAGRENYDGWRVVGGTPDNIHYSALDGINRGNVSQLKVAWTYD